jgi:hypothetical protein
MLKRPHIHKHTDKDITIELIDGKQKVKPRNRILTFAIKVIAK